MVQFDLLPSLRATTGTSPGLRAWEWGIVSSSSFVGYGNLCDNEFETKENENYT